MESALFSNSTGNYINLAVIDGLLVARTLQLQRIVAEQDYAIDEQQTGNSADCFWLLLGAVLVFFMQAGFAVLEVGNVRAKNSVNIGLKNVVDVSFGGLAFWILGWGLAYGNIGNNGFIGGSEFFLVGQTNFALWLFQFAFAATAATIVSGAVAERTRFRAYIIYTVLITGFIYPVVVHWVWSSTGFLSAFNYNANRLANGMIDFAGSGVVHMTGGAAALMGAVFVGPRKGRFSADGKPQSIQGHNPLLACLGVFILWFGWYGFNPGSTLMYTSGTQSVAALAAITTTLSAASATLTTLIVGRVASGHYDLGFALNGALAGLVSITAGCSVVDPYAAVLIGIIGALVYFGTSNLLLRWRVDDPLDAAPIHLFAGMWGVLSVGFFATPAKVIAAYGDFGGYDNVTSSAGVFFESRSLWEYADEALSQGNGQQLALQFLGSICILAWSTSLSATTFSILKILKVLRVTEECEESGLDRAFHGGSAYPDFDVHERKSLDSSSSSIPPGGGPMNALSAPDVELVELRFDGNRNTSID